MSYLRFDMTVPNSLLQLQSVLSSAKLHISDLIWRRNKPLIKLLKIKGPKIDPCGIPAIMSYQELKKDNQFQFFVYDYLDNQKIFKLILCRPYASNIAISKS